MTALRFWEKVLIGGPGCWEWQAGKSNPGYGVFRLNNANMFAHRMSWLLINGKIPPGICVLHKCDNPGCVRPDHLFLGTNLDNIADKTAKGRTWKPKGGDHPAARLTVSDVLGIRKAFEEGQDPKEVANKYGVTRRHAAAIFYREKWKHVA